jgi:hypothetical protein
MIENKKSDVIFSGLIIIVGIICVIPQILYQPFILQGDHGRDLYIFQLTANGSIPYIDYSTSNGPLMPYYYAFFLRFFGNSIQNVLMGYAILIFAAGFLLYRLARKGMTPIMALLCAFWYWAWRGEEFFYTYNHIGAIASGLAVLLFTIRFFHQPNRRNLLWGIFLSIVTILIRPDIGLAALTGLCLTALLRTNSSQPASLKSFFLILSAVSILFIIFFICFFNNVFQPYWSSINWNNFLSNILLLGNIWFIILTQNFLIGGISMILGLYATIGLFQLWKTRHQDSSKIIWSLLKISLLFFILFLMEFLLGTRFFRWVWVLPIGLLILFYCVQQGLNTINRYFRILFYVLMFSTCTIFILSQYASILVSYKKNVRLNVEQTHLYLSTDQKPWVETVEKTCSFLLTHTQPDEPILTIPYDALYCFLTQRPLAVRNPSMIGATGEEELIAIEQKHVRIIIISNRAFSHHEEDRFGILGKDYGNKLWSYIQQNYALIAQIGPWDAVATPVYNHAVRIYSRKTPFLQ